LKGLNSRLIGLGHFFDPRNVQSNNLQILQDLLAKNTISFSQVEDFLSHLGGRWAIIVTLGDSTRIYHDAAGLKTVFYCRSSLQSGEMISVASQPALLEAIGVANPNIPLRRQYEHHSPMASWPVHTIPYKGVKQLLPNHTFDLQTGESIRYWPKDPIEPLSLEVASQSMANLLINMLKAITNRHECVMSLTGGYDTRLLLACAHPLLDKLEFLTIFSPYTKNYDIKIPCQISNDYHLKYTALYESPSDPFYDILKFNVGGMFYGESASIIKSLVEYVGDRIHLTGAISELNRICKYYKNGKHPKKITTPRQLIKRCEFNGNKVAKEGIEKWWNEAPPLGDLNLNLLDLFYWEARMGVWGSCGFALREAAIDQIPPFNCREYIVLGLAVNDIKSRIEPYPLVREIIKKTDPNLLNYPFNFTLGDSLSRILHFPKRVARRVIKRVA
jgi:hypothetical protein